MVDARCVRSSMAYGSDTRPLQANVGLKFERAEMHIIRWMCDVSMKDRRTSGESIKLVGIEPITTVIRSGMQYSSTDVLSYNTILPAKYVFMKSEANKIQLIKSICTV